MTKFDDVKRFMEMAKQNVPSKPTIDGYPFDLRIRLIDEEASEFAEACGYTQTSWTHQYKRASEPNMVEMIDALVDIMYVTYGAAIAMGLTRDQFDLFWRAVHDSNMAKLNGPVVNGKLMKPDGWKKPNIAGILADVVKLSETPADPSPSADVCQCCAHVASYHRQCFNNGPSVLLTNGRERQWVYLCTHHTNMAKKDGVRLLPNGTIWKVDRLNDTPGENQTD